MVENDGTALAKVLKNLSYYYKICSLNLQVYYILLRSLCFRDKLKLLLSILMCWIQMCKRNIITGFRCESIWCKIFEHSIMHVLECRCWRRQCRNSWRQEVSQQLTWRTKLLRLMHTTYLFIYLLLLQVGTGTGNYLIHCSRFTAWFCLFVLLWYLPVIVVSGQYQRKLLIYNRSISEFWRVYNSAKQEIQLLKRNYVSAVHFVVAWLLCTCITETRVTETYAHLGFGGILWSF